MKKRSVLLDSLNMAIKTMTPGELAKFRSELKRRLPDVINQAAQAAKTNPATSKPQQAEVNYDGKM